MGIAGCLSGFAEMERVLGQPERAKRLLAFVETFLKSHQRALRTLVEHLDYERSLNAARAQLDDVTFSAAWQAGSKMTLDQALALALEPPA